MPTRILLAVLVGLTTGAQQDMRVQYEFDPELYVEWTTPAPRDEAVTWQFSSGATWVGNLYAGRTEFPWVVDIRYEDLNQEDWGIGNIITWHHVLTTCHVIAYFVEMEKERFKEFHKIKNKELNSKIEYRTGVKISYCTTYLWMDYEQSYRWGVAEGELDPVVESGTRLVGEMNVHPECQLDSIINDLAILRLQTPIFPLPPIISYMPIPFRWSTYEIPISDLSSMAVRKMMCYVASFGRGYKNINYHRAVDYKVKYRVYYDTWRLCFEAWDKFNHDAAVKQLHEYLTREDKLMCLMSRAKVGTVCHHDQGAPLVCDGEVYGIVVVGAHYEYCSNLIPMPFFVLKVNTFHAYYMDFIKVLYPLTGASFARTRRSRAPSVNLPPPYLCVLATISLHFLLYDRIHLN